MNTKISFETYKKFVCINLFRFDAILPIGFIEEIEKSIDINNEKELKEIFNRENYNIVDMDDNKILNVNFNKRTSKYKNVILCINNLSISQYIRGLINLYCSIYEKIKPTMLSDSSIVRYNKEVNIKMERINFQKDLVDVIGSIINEETYIDKNNVISIIINKIVDMDNTNIVNYISKYKKNNPYKCKDRKNFIPLVYSISRDLINSFKEKFKNRNRGEYNLSTLINMYLYQIKIGNEEFSLLED